MKEPISARFTSSLDHEIGALVAAGGAVRLARVPSNPEDAVKKEDFERRSDRRGPSHAHAALLKLRLLSLPGPEPFMQSCTSGCAVSTSAKPTFSLRLRTGLVKLPQKRRAAASKSKKLQQMQSGERGLANS
jgi:hypothetical protein